MGGIAFRAPVLAALFLIVALATLAMPGLGELRRRVPDPDRRCSGRRSSIAIVASAGVVLAAVYMIRMFMRSMHNRVRAAASSRVELTLRDAAVIVPLVACILALALYPQFVLTDSERAVKRVGGDGAAGGRDGVADRDRGEARRRDRAVQGARTSTTRRSRR